MQVLVHDYSGHPFQVELSGALADRGHDVVHSWCEAHVSGKGRLDGGGSTVRFESIGRGEVIDKLDFGRRLVQELRFGVQLVRQIRARRPDVVLIANTPIPMLLVVTAYLRVTGTPWVLWHQDVQGIAARSFAGTKLSRAFVLVGRVMAVLERWCARRAAHVVVISDAFLDVHRSWGTVERTTVIPNWAPLDDLVPVSRDNSWAREHGLDDRPALVYSGTLGLKHRPELLVRLAAEVRRGDVDLTLAVVSEGPASEVLRAEADALGVPVVLLPFQPFDRLSEVLGSGDVLVVLLDQSAGAFSVPSKTLSYLCAGRPVLGLMPSENLAAELIEKAGGMVGRPTDEALPEAAAWVTDLLHDDVRRDDLGRRSRMLAEKEFALDGCAERFERILVGASRP